MNTTYIAGSGKNAGKTVALKRLLASLREGGAPLAVVTIGNDGEQLDSLTGERKPAIEVQQGHTVCTTEGALRRSEARSEILRVLGFSKGREPLLIVRALRPGAIETVGPDTVSQLRRVLEELRGLEVQDVLVDGTANRLSQASPMPGSGLVYVASVRDYDSRDHMEEELVFLSAVFNGLPQSGTDDADRVPPGCVGVAGAEGELRVFPAPGWSGSLDAAVADRSVTVVINRPATGRFMQALLDRAGRVERIVFGDPLKVRFAPSLLAELRGRGVDLSVARTVRLRSIFASHVGADFLARLRGRLETLPVCNALLAEVRAS